MLVGRPQGLSEAQRKVWDVGMVDLACAFEEERAHHQRDFQGHGRGDFGAFAMGFTMGPSCSIRRADQCAPCASLTASAEAHQPWL